MIDANSQFFAILTKVGEAKQANADALGIPWLLTHMGVGDANGTDPVPDRLQTKLINEWRRRPLNQLKIDPANEAVIIAEQIIPADEGGKWIREIGLYDADGDLVAVANCAPSFKPVLSQGSGRTQVVRMNFIVTNSGVITLKIDPAVVLATREYVDGLTGRASQADAEKGEDSLLIMTPLRVFQAIAKVVRQATETASGWAKIATQDQVSAGLNDATIVTAKKLRGAQASQAEAELGTNDTKLMTPLRVFQAVAQPKRFAMFTANGSWTCPAGVTEILVNACGGGAGGAGSNGSTNAGQGGGGGACLRDQRYAVEPGRVYAVTIGKGGAGGAVSSDGVGGSLTSLGAVFTLPGGVAGSRNGVGFGGPGGWGGQPGGDSFALGGAGGSTLFGAGGAPRAASGYQGTGFGAGGAGGSVNWAGGAGADGFISIRW